MPVPPRAVERFAISRILQKKPIARCKTHSQVNKAVSLARSLNYCTECFTMNLVADQAEFITFMLFPGGAGGLSSFLAGLKSNHYRNNRYLSKFCIEVVGGALTASSLVYVFKDNQYVYVFAFVIGTAWSQILQRIREKVTTLVESAIGEKAGGAK
jgi:hypothetical protein